MTKAEACAPRDGALPSGWLNRPLCRRYVLAIFDVAVVRCHDAQGCRDQAVHWGIGGLPDGACDFLGAWIEPGRDSEGPLRMLADLKGRGVERMWHVTGAGPGLLRERASAELPGTTVGSSSVGRLFTEAFAPSPARVAEQVRAGLARAIRRHGSFESGAAVLDFMADALQRAERRLDRERLIAKGRPRLDSGVQMASPAL